MREKTRLYRTMLLASFMTTFSPSLSAQESGIAEVAHHTGSANSRDLPNVESIFMKETVSVPETASLQAIVSRPVNYSTGTVNIEIPLYTVEIGSLKLPLLLRYDTSGVKVGSPSGWVGQNWTLAAEPVVSVEKKGHYDDDFICDFTMGGPKTYLYALMVLDSSNPYSSNDESPDEYYYHLAGRNGMFMYLKYPDQQRFRFASFPYDNLSVKVEGSPVRYFVLTDDDGVVYRFDGPQIYSTNPHSPKLGWKASSMVSANGLDSIQFQYGELFGTTQYFHPESYQVVDYHRTDLDYHYTTRPSNYTDISQLNYSVYSRDIVDTEMKSPIVYHNTDNHTVSYQLIGGELVTDNAVWNNSSYVLSTNSYSKQLSRIVFGGNTVEFTKDNSGNRLGEITVRNYMGETVRRITFVYESSSGRDYLTMLTFQGENMAEKEIYRFAYDNIAAMPSNSNTNMDFWGYLNAVSTTPPSSLVPKMTLKTLDDSVKYVPDAGFQLNHMPHVLKLGNTDSLSRASREEWMRKGSLTSITYPTGGREEYVFEANRGYLPFVPYEEDQPQFAFHMSQHLVRVAQDSDVYYVGGLRVKQIRTIGSDGTVSLRTFEYGDDGAGTLPIVENFNYFMQEQEKFYPHLFYPGYIDIGITYKLSTRYRTISPSPSAPLSFDNGASVMYGKVTEYFGTPEENEGKTVYTFSIPPYIQQFSLDGHFNGHPYEDWKYGRLLTRTIYGRSPSGYYPLDKEEHVYSQMKQLGCIAVGSYELTGICSLSDHSEAQNFMNDIVETGFLWKQDSIKVRGIAEVETKHVTYDQDGRQMVDETDYGYGLQYTILPTYTETRRNSSAPYATHYYYPEAMDGDTYSSQMVSANVLSPVIMTLTGRGGQTISSHTPFNGFYKPSGLRMRFDNGTWTNRMQNTYDSQGRLVASERDGRERVCYVYGYRGRQVIARIENCSFASLTSLVGGANVLEGMAMKDSPSSADWSLFNGLRSELPNAHVTVYRHKPLVGVTSVTDPTGLETRYSYDGLGRLSARSVVRNGVEELEESYDYHYVTEE